MSTVFMMRFNRDQAAVIADESTWHLSFKYGYRRSNYGDHVLPLMTSELAEKSGICAVYAGVGYPSFHGEVVANAKSALSNTSFTSLNDVSSLVFKEYQKVHGRMVNDRIRFLLGFGREELNSLTMKRPDRNYSIKQESLVEDAKKVLAFRDKSDPMLRIFMNSGIVLGHSAREGVQGYRLSGDNKGVDFAYELSTIGDGHQIATHIFGQTAAKMDLPSRRNGFSMLDGLLVLMEVAINTRTFQARMGGYFQMAVINGQAACAQDKIKEMSDHRMKLAIEVASAYTWELLDHKDATQLLDGLIFGNTSFHQAEQAFWSKAKNPSLLRRYLVGYRPKTSKFHAGEKIEVQEVRELQGEKQS